MKVAIFGVGYVGLTFAVHLASKGINIIGVDISNKTIDSLNSNVVTINEEGLSEKFLKYRKMMRFVKKLDEKVDVFVVTVGTPVLNGRIVLSKVIDVVNEVANNLSGGELVILRSTLKIGSTRNVVKKILDESGKKYFLGFCPERTVEGKALQELASLPQIVGGIDEESSKEAANFFKKLGNEVVSLKTIEAAELVKLINNNYRYLTFAFSNEMAVFAEEIGIDFIEVVKAANYNYSRSSVPLPGLAAGPCLPKDAVIILESAKEKNLSLNLVNDAFEVNASLPEHVARKVSKLIKNKKEYIIVSGLAFKGRPKNTDMRGSQSVDVVNELKHFGFSNILVHDFEDVHNEPEMKNLVSATENEFERATVIVITNNNVNYESDEFVKKVKDKIVFDTNGVLKNKKIKHYHCFGVGDESNNC